MEITSDGLLTALLMGRVRDIDSRTQLTSPGPSAEAILGLLSLGAVFLLIQL